MATATSRKAKPAPSVLKKRRALAQERIEIERRLTPDYARIGELDAELKQIATDAGESFKEIFGKDYVSVSPAHAAEFKGNIPVVVPEAWNKLKPAAREKLVEQGIVAIEPSWGKASGGRVNPKVA